MSYLLLSVPDESLCGQPAGAIDAGLTPPNYLSPHDASLLDTFMQNTPGVAQVEVVRGVLHLYRKTCEVGRINDHNADPPSPTGRTGPAVDFTASVESARNFSGNLSRSCNTLHFAVFSQKATMPLERLLACLSVCEGRICGSVKYFVGLHHAHVMQFEAKAVDLADDLITILSGFETEHDLLTVFPLCQSSHGGRPVSWADVESEMSFSRPVDAPPSPLRHSALPAVGTAFPQPTGAGCAADAATPEETIPPGGAPATIPCLRVAEFTELPLCPFCLERLDASVSGLSHMLCVHKQSCPCHFTSRCRVCEAWRRCASTSKVAARQQADLYHQVRYSLFEPQQPEPAEGSPVDLAVSPVSGPSSSSGVVMRKTASPTDASHPGSGPFGSSPVGGGGLTPGEMALPMLDDLGAAASPYLKSFPTLPGCQVCSRKDSLWACLVCGFIGCGRYSGQHTLKHCFQTGHTLVMELASQKIWDYDGDLFVHRLLIHCEGDAVYAGAPNKDILPDQCPPDFDRKEPVDGKSIVDAKMETKHEMMCLEFSRLLAQQLESGRRYHTERLAGAREANAALAEEVRVAEEARAVRQADEEAAIGARRAELAVEEQRAAELSSQLEAAQGEEGGIQRQIKEAKTTERESLEAKSAEVKSQLEATMRAVFSKGSSIDGEIQECRSQIRDLEAALDMRNKCKNIDTSKSITFMGEAAPAPGRRKGKRK